MKKPILARLINLPASRLPIIDQAEVVVVGGGNAGFIAAVASARAGARTLLVERYGFLGGSLTGTYASSPGFFGDSLGNQVIRGIGWEFVERMEAAGAAIVDRQSWQVQTFPEAAKSIALDMVIEAGVILYLHSWVGQVIQENGLIKGIVIQSKSGRQVITGKVFVDTTGDADLAHWSGAPTELLSPDHLWQTSVDLTVCNIDFHKVVRWAQENESIITWFSQPRQLDQPGIRPMISMLIRQESLEGENGDVIHVGPVPTIKLMIHSSIGRVQGSVEIDGTDVRQLTAAEIEARRRALDHLDYLRCTVPGFEQAVVVAESQLGVRETRRIIGDYVITLDDLLNNARFPDTVALNCRALDQHLKGDAFKYQLLHGSHDIPLRALLPQGIENLLVAGRCISSDHAAHASLRGAATCLATGHATGTAAALAAQANGRPRCLDIRVVQEALLSQGAILKSESNT